MISGRKDVLFEVQLPGLVFGPDSVNVLWKLIESDLFSTPVQQIELIFGGNETLSDSSRRSEA